MKGKGKDQHRERGRAEVRLSRQDPARRGVSPLGQLTAGPGWRVALRLAAMRFPSVTRILIAAPCWVASSLMRLGIGRDLLMRVVGTRNSFDFFWGAIEEAGGWDAFTREFALRLPVLCYHHVGEEFAGSWPLLTVSTKVFRRQMKWLVDNDYTGIHAADWLAWVQQGTALPAKPVLVTFDDGYSDLVENAIPVLETDGIKATIFIVSQHIGDASTWDVALGHPSRPLMNAEQVRECRSHGIEIGAHSRTHPDLRKLQDADLRNELDGCRAELTELMGAPVKTLAYCFGFQNEQVRKRAAETYDLAFTCKPGLNAWRSDPHCLRRMFAHPSRLNFFLQVKYGIDLHAAYRFIAARTGGLLRRSPRSVSGQEPVPSVARTGLPPQG
jgi:peptidoglycan/xylan/chitin deacetylase (PgdA/CDA1 family)